MRVTQQGRGAAARRSGVALGVSGDHARPRARPVPGHAREFCQRILQAGGEVCVTFTVRDLHPDFMMHPGETIMLGFGGCFGATLITHESLVCPARVGPYDRSYHVCVPWGCVRAVTCMDTGHGVLRPSRCGGVAWISGTRPD